MKENSEAIIPRNACVIMISLENLTHSGIEILLMFKVMENFSSIDFCSLFSIDTLLHHFK